MPFLHHSQGISRGAEEKSVEGGPDCFIEQNATRDAQALGGGGGRKHTRACQHGARSERVEHKPRERRT